MHAVVVGVAGLFGIGYSVGVRIRENVGDIDRLNKVPFKKATSRVQKGPPLRGLPNTT